ESLPAAPPSMLADSIGASPPLRPPQAKAEPLPEKPVEEGENRKFYPAQERRAKTANQKPPTKDGLLAANFTPSETLDPLVGAVTRSSGLSDIQPPAGAELKIGEAVVFSWQTSVEGPLTLRLLNNREEEIFNRTVESNRLSSPMTLQPGLYYWKLETVDDLIYIGKFIVIE
ncbi:MAG: hypothetical protein KDD09_27050, partial [Phaeodactylibacter sp.]|nr:hypothetical protein [Phaeodactylibacter sp.]